MERRRIHAFDFDGTLTRRDSFIALLRFVRGDAAFIMGMLACSPWLALMKLRLYSNGKAKQRVFSRFFRGMREQDFRAVCQRFAAKNASLMRPKALDFVRKALQRGEEAVVLSASMESWIRPFLAPLENSTGRTITVAGTEAEAEDGVLTGRFSTPNCYGGEKVRRLKALLPRRDDYIITAYGDSRGDKELMDYADESLYRPFE